jgi:hypothetical protein
MKSLLTGTIIDGTITSKSMTKEQQIEEEKTAGLLHTTVEIRTKSGVPISRHVLLEGEEIRVPEGMVGEYTGVTYYAPLVGADSDDIYIGIAATGKQEDQMSEDPNNGQDFGIDDFDAEGYFESAETEFEFLDRVFDLLNSINLAGMKRKDAQQATGALMGAQFVIQQRLQQLQREGHGA